MAVSAVVLRPFATVHPDALPCIAELRRRGPRLGAAGNMRAVHDIQSLAELPEVLP